MPSKNFTQVAPFTDANFAVVVEQEIGRVTVGYGEGEHPFDAAVKLCCKHQHDTQFADATYHFPGPDEYDVVTVQFNKRTKESV